MFVRVVRFTGVSQETIDKVSAQIDESDGPPPGVNAKKLQMAYDASQGTSLVMLTFDSEEDMKTADEVMGAMDPGETPGQRSSVDLCEVVKEMTA